MQSETPAAPVVRKTLERVLASNAFSRSERARDLLRYLVEREQAGQADRLKGFAIAVDVFGKDVDFDPSTDAVVRVQAGRLRELLQQYSASEGASDPLRIVVPRGGYIPEYVQNGPEPCPADVEEAQPSQPEQIAADATGPSLSRQINFMWAAIGLLVVSLAVLYLRQTQPAGHQQANMLPEASLTGSIGTQAPDTLPVIYISTAGDAVEQAAMLATLRSGLSGFDTIDFIGRDFEGKSDPVSQAMSFVFRIGPGRQPGGVTVELQNIGNDRVLLSRTFEADEIGSSRIEDSVAALLSTTTTASGTIYAYIEQAGVQTGLTRCLLLNDDYYQDPIPAVHKAAYSCFEQLIGEGGKSPLIYSEMAVLHLQALTSRYDYPENASHEKALSMAHRAVQMGAASAYAHRAYGYLNSRLGNAEESIRWMRKAYELNTYDLSMAAAYGYGLIFAGDYVQGTPIMARAVDGSSSRPSWWDFGLFLGQFMRGDMKMAVNAAESLKPAAPRSHYLAARLIAAGYTKDTRARDQLIATLSEKYPRFVANPRRVFEQREYPPDMVEKLVEALRAAGLDKAD
ncbi:tetratricopeptide repeat protein [Aquamicrobium ahrensii]|uniref:Tetratricopeptide (TPR) repeat protein n=1 Tax=Aquamicrobium ahrensii TaxID=469551 RepID=A0ABV2KJ10_9HYPH